jgi:DNA-binding response OmpR family regulator
METHMQLNRELTPAGLERKSNRLGLGLIVAHEDDGFIQRVCQQFDRLGWDVYPAHSPNEVRRLALEMAPGVVILPTQFHEESGWLTCAKLVQDRPGHKVILVGPCSTPELQRYTAFVGGASLLRLDASLRSLVDEVCQAANVQIN